MPEAKAPAAAGLAREVGPGKFKLPLWMWGAVGIGGFLLYRRVADMQSGAATAGSGAGGVRIVRVPKPYPVPRPGRHHHHHHKPKPKPCPHGYHRDEHGRCVRTNRHRHHHGHRRHHQPPGRHQRHHPRHVTREP